MRAKRDIQRDVELEIRYNPAIDSREVGVRVGARIVILTGFVRSHAERFEAERDARRVAGVAAIANELEVKLASSYQWPRRALLP